MIVLEYAALVLLGYLLGAIPSALIAGKLLRGIDLRQYGSGNLGAANTLRTLGPVPSALVFLADLLKAALPVLLARWLTGLPMLEVAVGLAAIMGHNWPVYVGWRGGRGVSSTFGVGLAFSPLVAAASLVLFVAIVALTRYVSLGSIVASVAGGLLFLLLVWLSWLPNAYAYYAIVAAVLIVIRHRGNIARLYRGTERKLGQTVETSHP